MKTLWYDETCPICRSFKAELEERTDGELQFKVSDPDSKSFKYENENGVFEGREAIATLMKDFPDLVPVLAMLPENWKIAIMQTMTSIASLGRTIIKKTEKVLNKKGCNCGGKI